MPETQQKPLSKVTTFHSYNGDLSLCAVSHGNEEVVIYDTQKNSEDVTKWEKKAVLKEHAQFISGIDWCVKTNMIVTCSHDRNAYVWTQDEAGEWKPTLVVLRISRAATDVKWSPSGDKFAVTSGAKCVPVCHFDESQNWWISKMIKKHKSTVLSLDWSPNSKYVVTGACDFKCRVFSAFLKEAGDTPGDDEYGLGKDHEEFGEMLFEYDQAKAWVNSVAWAPDGLSVAFAGQGSTLSIAKFGGDVQTIFSEKLPFLHVGYGTDTNTIVAVGFDNNPAVFKLEGGEYKIDKYLDPETDGKGDTAQKVTTARSAAFAKFQAADSRGSVFGGKEKKIECYTFHKNTIIGVQFHGNKITTSAYDGRILTWTL